MSTKAKFLIIMVAVALPAFIFGRQIWPPAGEVVPVGMQLPLLMVLSLLEALSFGAGIAFLALGWPKMKALGGSNPLTKWAFLSVVWLMANWWSHDGFHAANGENLDGLIRIEFAYHVTLEIAGAVLALWFWRMFQGSRTTT